MKFSAVFFDRDGTVIVDKHYLKDPSGVELIPHAAKALAFLARQGSDAFLVSNQSGVGRGFFNVRDVERCQTRLQRLLMEQGAGFKDYRFCPHAPEEHCNCRKPAIGMWESLRQAHRLEASLCAMIGDKREDLLFGINARFAVCVLVLTGKGMSALQSMGIDAGSVGSGLTPICPQSIACDPAAVTQLYAARSIDQAVEGIAAL